MTSVCLPFEGSDAPRGGFYPTIPTPPARPTSHVLPSWIRPTASRSSTVSWREWGASLRTQVGGRYNYGARYWKVAMPRDDHSQTLDPQATAEGGNRLDDRSWYLIGTRRIVGLQQKSSVCQYSNNFVLECRQHVGLTPSGTHCPAIMAPPLVTIRLLWTGTGGYKRSASSNTANMWSSFPTLIKSISLSSLKELRTWLSRSRKWCGFFSKNHVQPLNKVAEVSLPATTMALALLIISCRDIPDPLSLSDQLITSSHRSPRVAPKRRRWSTLSAVNLEFLWRISRSFFGAIKGMTQSSLKRRIALTMGMALTLPWMDAIQSCVLSFSRQPNESPKAKSPMMSKVVQLYHSEMSCEPDFDRSRSRCRSRLMWCWIIGCWARIPLSEKPLERRRR